MPRLYLTLTQTFRESAVGHNSATGTVKAFMVNFRLHRRQEREKNDKGY
jgi:hypothetical protein